MEKNLLEELRQRLESKKSDLETSLEKIAKKDERLPDDWDAKYPHSNSASGSSAMEDEADEVQEYNTRLPLEHSLEEQLRDINTALEKIQKGTYGKCGKCGKDIDEERLKALPEAKFCVKCEAK